MSFRPGSPSPSAPADPFALSARWLCGLVFIAALLAYLPALGGGLLWDDVGHLTRADLRSLDGLRRIWFELGATQQYYPLLHSAFWLEHQLWGDATLGYHLANVLQHALVACLFGALLRRLAVPGAALAALLFALHPVCVESVAWISEQKNTLSAVFYLAAALAFLTWHGRPARESVPVVARASRPCQGTDQSTGETPVPPFTSPPPAGKRGQSAPTRRRPGTPPFWYCLASFLFACALLTKTVTASLPAALLVILWWRDGRLDWRRDVIPLLPWFALSLAGGTLTAYFEHTLIGAQGDGFDLSLLERTLLAGRVVWFYLGKLLWPADLTFIYPRWTIDATAGWQWLFPLAALALLFALWRLARTAPQPSTPNPQLPAFASAFRRLGERGRRAPLAAALLFGGTLFPVLGFFNVYPFVFSYVADHFQYLASLPIFALAAAAITFLIRRAATRSAPGDRAEPDPRRERNAPPAQPLPALARLGPFALVLVLGALTFLQARAYHDAITLYRTTLARNPQCWMAHNNLAVVLANQGQFAEAVPHLEQALKLRPDYPQALSNLGDSLRHLGRLQESLAACERAVQLQPDFLEAHTNLGTTLLALDRPADAVRHYERTVQLDPHYAAGHYNLGLALARLDRVRDAIPEFERSLALRPDNAEAELSLAFALMTTERFSDSLPHFQRAIELDPESVNAQQTYARALARHGRLEDALPHFRAVVELAPNSGAAHLDLAYALRQLGRVDEALPHFQEAQRLGAR